ncbi:MAG: PTS sugar transporter subunit IIA [Kangiella sp.]|jgi:PTS system nitrogen regulatory IIA component|nr:PTS sugar transporter subunit IIA [Kangiella sp.]MCW9027293.1 PTS sugar transporter subunit IIA [Kangiella sp.]
MQIEDVIVPELCVLGAQATSRKKALQFIANLFAEHSSQYESFLLLKALVAREQLGTTAIGNGVALPHGRVKPCEQPLAVFVTLAEPIDFDAPDQEPVDIVFALIVPKHFDFQELKGLNGLIEILKDKKVCAQIRHAHNNQALYEIIEGALAQHAKKTDKSKDKVEKDREVNV